MNINLHAQDQRKIHKSSLQYVNLPNTKVCGKYVLCEAKVCTLRKSLSLLLFLIAPGIRLEGLRVSFFFYSRFGGSS